MNSSLLMFHILSNQEFKVDKQIVTGVDPDAPNCEAAPCCYVLLIQFPLTLRRQAGKAWRDMFFTVKHVKFLQLMPNIYLGQMVKCWSEWMVLKSLKGIMCNISILKYLKMTKPIQHILLSCVLIPILFPTMVKPREIHCFIHRYRSVTFGCLSMASNALYPLTSV